MFDFFDMVGNYETRKVARYEKGKILVSTAVVSDSPHPYETAVAHPKYNDGEIIIVAEYDDKESAKAGHDKWVKIMTAKELPASITDVSSCGIATLRNTIIGKPKAYKKRK